MKHPYPDVLESLTPLSPIPPKKFTTQSGEKHDSEKARNGTITPESNLAADYDVERAQRLKKTRWWNKVYSSVERFLVMKTVNGFKVLIPTDV